MMLIILQRPPTIASAEGLIIDPWSSSALKLPHEQKENPPWAEQGLATFLIQLLLQLHQLGHLKVLPTTSNQIKSSRVDFLTVG